MKKKDMHKALIQQALKLEIEAQSLPSGLKLKTNPFMLLSLWVLRTASYWEKYMEPIKVQFD
jgi:hypothetical protein